MNYGLRYTNLKAGIYTSTSDGKDSITIIVWVNNLLVISRQQVVNSFKAYITGRFNIKDLGLANYYFRLKVHCNHQARILQLDQFRYIKTVFKWFNINKATLNTMQMINVPISSCGNTSSDKFLYQEDIGSINYAAICTRPDISFTISYLGHFAAKPSG